MIENGKFSGGNNWLVWGIDKGRILPPGLVARGYPSEFCIANVRRLSIGDAETYDAAS